MGENKQLTYEDSLRQYKKKYKIVPQKIQQWLDKKEGKSAFVSMCNYSFRRGFKDFNDDTYMFYIRLFEQYQKVYEKKYGREFPVYPHSLNKETLTNIIVEAIDRGRPMTGKEIWGEMKPHILYD